MKILTNLETLKNGRVSPDTAAKMAAGGDAVLAYADDMSGTMDFATAKALAPVLDRTDLCDMKELGNEDPQTGMLLTAAVAAALSPDGTAAVVLDGLGSGSFRPAVDGKEFVIRTCGSIDGLYCGSSSPASPKADRKKKEAAPEAPVPEPEPESYDAPGEDEPVPSAAPLAGDIEVDAGILEPFAAYIPDDCGVDGVSRDDFCRALYKSLSESTSDADAVTKLESYVGGDAGRVMKMIKERGLYDELRDLALI